VVGLAWVLSGCSPFSAASTIFSQAKPYVVSQKQSFSHPLNKVMAASADCLRDTGFDVARVEHFNEKGLILGRWKDISVRLSMEAITPGMTKVAGKIHSSSSFREFSSETEIFTRVRSILERKEPLNWRELVSGMVAVHASPDEKSPVIAYFGPGANADVIIEEGDWGMIALMDNSAGYIPTIHIGTARAVQAQKEEFTNP